MQIGFSQRIQLEWLESTSQLFLAGNNKEQIEKILKDFLIDKLSVGGSAKRGNREKAITILMKIWVTVPDNLKPFRDDGLDLIRNLPLKNHLPVHWGMTMAVYPFFGVIAETVGRLLKLQQTISAAQIQKRVREQLGERETVARAARRVLRCFVDWGVLKDTEKKGVYRAIPRIGIDITKLKYWLVEAALISNGLTSLPFGGFFERAALYPFKIEHLNQRELELNPRLNIFRHGLDKEMVILK